ncbi:heterokaryon incompatibility protein-domain-containing protein [Aspergillus stella-maris]|uniref:heterokaryon incompatibility protein-domain-containing protein n=1 Tax=Aspergillus stella-maris TaxID=1810926 RepID=UPI003CCD393F
MHRWHESGCRRPDVSAASGLLCCVYCFATPSLEDHVFAPPLPPQLHDRTRMNLTWPSAVTYSNWEFEDKSPAASEDWDIIDAPPLETQRLLFPELPSNDSIRLLRLKPGTDDEPLHANLETVDINQIPLPLYEALSYTSVNDPADPPEPCPVFIGNYWDVAHVSTNCGKALRRLRRQNADRLLWVDSLCIDQGSLEEKNGQVLVLREIYSRATKVLSYVGDEPSDSRPVLSFLKDITAFQPASCNKWSLSDRNVKESLSTLLKRPYFSRLWVLQETLMAREVEIICGNVSARWPKRSFNEGSSEAAFSWLFRDAKWFPFTGRDLLNVLVDASPYKCSDQRDKVFAVLGLMGEKFIGPDYKISTESAYIGIAAYLIQQWQTLNIFALAGQSRSTLQLPSWVPDWSQSLSLPTLDTFLGPGLKNNPTDFLLEHAIPVKFAGISTENCDIKINADTGVIRFTGFRLCGVSGKPSQVRDYAHVELPLDPRGSLIVSIPHQNYEIHETDSVFLLNGYNHPVILRKGTNQATYTLVTACILSMRAPTPRLFIPWNRRQGRLVPLIQLKVSLLTPEDKSSLQQLYSRLDPTPLIDTPAATIRSRALNFLMVSRVNINMTEKWLRVDWNRYNQKLGWMFRDQSAIWQFLLEINQLELEERTGEDKIELKGDLQLAGKFVDESLSTYTWDLSQFIWSFLQPAGPNQAEQDIQWSPMVDRLRSHLPEVTKWAQVTEQLFKLFIYTSRLLGEAWEHGPFPGSHLPSKWIDNYANFLTVFRQQKQRPHLNQDCIWTIAEFESHLRARGEIWALRTGSDEIHSGNSNLESHALLHYAGMDLYSEQVIDIA